MWRYVIVPIVLDVSGGLGAFILRTKQNWGKSITFRSWQLTNLRSTLKTLTFSFDTGAFQQNTPPQFSSTQLHAQPMTLFCLPHHTPHNSRQGPIKFLDFIINCPLSSSLRSSWMWHCAAGRVPSKRPKLLAGRHCKTSQKNCNFGDSALNKSKQPSVTVLRDLSLYFATKCMWQTLLSVAGWLADTEPERKRSQSNDVNVTSLKYPRGYWGNPRKSSVRVSRQTTWTPEYKSITTITPTLCV